MFKRKIENVLNEYYDNPQDPIVIIDGARQVGKILLLGKQPQKDLIIMLK